MIGKLGTRDSNQVDNLNHTFTKAKAEDKTEATMTDTIMISKVIRIDIDPRVETGDSIDKTEVDLGMHKIIGEEILEVMWECIKTLKEKTGEENTEIIIETKVMAEVEIGTGIEKGHFPETLAAIETIGVQSTVGPRSGSRASMKRDRIRCYKCTEYDHFAKDCPTYREERELEQLQQMLNIDDEQMSLKPLAMNTHDNLNSISLEGNLRPGHLKL